MRGRRTLCRAVAAALAAGPLLATPAGAQVTTPPTSQAPLGVRIAEGTFDALVLRPLGFAAAAVGCALFVPVALLTSPGGRDPVEEALDHFVIGPGRYVFTRPLGDF